MARRQLFRFVTVAALGCFCVSASADETTRQVQEELRRRHLYYNEIDGRTSRALNMALQRYQQRQGFAVTGVADDQTLRSLGVVKELTPPAEGEESLPDEPVLRSDAPVPDVPHMAGAVKVANTGPLTRKEAEEFVRRYLAARSSPNDQDEIAFYGDKVDYYDHGVVDRRYVHNELVAYDQRWPARKYTLISPVRISRASGHPVAKFRVAFQVANQSAFPDRHAGGQTDDSLGLSRGNGGRLEIASVREQRVRRSHRRSSAPPVLRSARRVLRSIFH